MADIDATDDEPFAGPEPKASAGVLAALRKAEDAFREWQATCTTIDEIYNLEGTGYGGVRADLDVYGWRDAKLDMFWASYEILKPAVYARPPQPVVTPLFKDNRPLHNITAELLERCAVSTFTRTAMNDVMLHTRDDMIFAGRGVPWVRYDTDDGQQVCVEHLDRADFLHEPARKWSEVGWVARRAWLTKKDMRKRFRKASADAYQDAKFTARRDDDHDGESRAVTRKAGVWEVWHRADNKVYWVTEGASVFLDTSAPEVKLSGFFPCPRPAYATLKRRSLIPVPDWERYAIHFRKISDLTGRIYLLLDKVRMKGLIPAGGDIGDAVEELIRSDDDEILIPVPGAALMAGSAAGFVSWLPLAELAQAIQGLIEARGQLINDFFQLSGISDIMRGATEAEETLGAQQLKSQYGSVRVREKSAELQRVAADAVKIAAEIIAEKFTTKTLLDMSQMDVPTKAEIKKRIDEVEKAAREELKALADKAQDMAERTAAQPQAPAQPGQSPQGTPDPAQAEQAFQQAQQQILAKYAPMLQEAEHQVPIEAVVELLRDDRARNFTFEIESSSTILTDELAEKQSRNEFMAAFTQSSQALMGMAAMGEEGAKLAGQMMKFVLAPYRAGRELDSAIDAFIEAAPKLAQQAAGQGDDNAQLAEANNKLAEAEMVKAQAQVAKVQADAANGHAQMQAKMADMQTKAQQAQAKSEQDMGALQIKASEAQSRADKMAADIDLVRAQTAKLLASIGLDARKQDLDEYQVASGEQERAVDRAMSTQSQQQDAQFRERGEQRADRQQDFSETQAEQQARESREQETTNG